MNSMTILQVGYPFARSGDNAVGGAEQILGIVTRGVAAAGHRLIVMGGQTPECSDLDATALELGRARHAAAVREAVAESAVDIVHIHGLDFAHYLPPAHIPVLVTLHLPPDFYQDTLSRTWPASVFFNCVSKSQHAQLEQCASGVRAAVIPNGIEVARFTHGSRKKGFALSLGRICPEKGFHLALEAARCAGIDWMLGGQVYPYEAHRRYFAQVLQPQLDARRRFLGPLGFHAKQRLLAEAKCLLIPSIVSETSSLVAMEALASGTPVIALRSGALPEIVEHGRTGFIVDDVTGMARAIADVNDINPEECRRAARERFPADRMVNGYLEMYRSMLASRPRAGEQSVMSSTTKSESKSKVTTDHEEIRHWAEERGAHPACVKGTGGKNDVGMIRLDFPGYSGEGKLEEISWDDFFEEFDKKRLALVYQETTAEGERSNFNKLVSRDHTER